MPSRKLMAGAAGVVLFVTGAATALADRSETGTTTTATTVPSTSVATTATVPATTAPATTTQPTTVPATTTSPATTAPPTTTVPASTPPPVATPPASKPRPKPEPPRHAPAVRLGPATGVRRQSLGGGCPVAAVVLLLPHREPLVLGRFAAAPARQASIPRLVYRDGGGIVTGAAATMSERACTPYGPAGARATVTSLSLFQGAVRAGRVTLTREGRIAVTVTGLRVDGKPISPRSGARIRVPGIGYLIAGPDVRERVSHDTFAGGALALHLTTAHVGLPAGSVVIVAAVGLPQVVARSASARPATHRHSTTRHPRKKRSAVEKGQPLTVTPPLAFPHYVFPVAGHSDYGDSYGAFRGDVAGEWHHGDDIFAALGTPVVAVASGTINRVGWEKIGGWRLWVRDGAGDEFYYAHLSGYAPSDLRSNRVRAGQVIGFVGNTGDAFTTAPHLHFEIHPRRLLHLGYDGAVDPTSYLDHWSHLTHVVAPRPVHPPLPGQPQVRSEARYVFRELLAARHLATHAPSPKARPHVAIPDGSTGDAPTPRDGARQSAAPVATTARNESTLAFAIRIALAALIGGCAAGGAVALLRRRRGRQLPTPQ